MFVLKKVQFFNCVVLLFEQHLNNEQWWYKLFLHQELDFHRTTLVLRYKGLSYFSAGFSDIFPATFFLWFWRCSSPVHRKAHTYVLNLIFLCKIYKEELIIQCTAFFFFNFIFYVILFIICLFIYFFFYFFSGCSEAIAIFCFWGHGRSVHVATLGNASPTTMHTRFVYIENLWSTYWSLFRLWIFSPAIGRVLIIIINYIS